MIGRNTGTEAHRVVEDARGRIAEADRAAKSLRILLYGSFPLAVGMTLLDRLLPEDWVQALAEHALMVALGLAGTWALGPGAFRASLGVRLRGRDVPATLAVGVVGGFLKWGSIVLLIHALGRLAYGPLLAWDLPFLLHSVTVPVLLQEWVYRGVTFEAARRLCSDRTAILVGAAQFAFVYGLAWRPLSVPAHFAWGLLLGWLRHRTGSVVACVLAHALGKTIVFLVPIP